MMDCLKDIVGVTATNNAEILAGLTDEQKTQLKKSVSGLYLDDLPGGVHLKAVRNADATKGLYEMSTGAIRNGIRQLGDDLILEINKDNTKSRKNFVGQIGRLSYSQTLGVSQRYQGMRLRPLDLADAVITLNRIIIVLNGAATFDIVVYKVPYKTAVGTVVKTIPVTTVANMFATVDVDIETGGLELPLVENGQIMEYWILYDTQATGGAIPKDNKLACSTCDGSASSALNDYLKVNGVEVTSLADLQSGVLDDYSHGLTLDVSIKCEANRLFCNQYREDEAVAVTMAHAVRFKAGELLIESVMQSPDISRYTTMDRERLWGKRNHYRTEYLGRVQYLAQAIDLSGSNCYTCREQTNQPYVGGIYS